MNAYAQSVVEYDADGAFIDKTPVAVLDYPFNFRRWLIGADRIQSVTVTVVGGHGIILTHTHDGLVVSVWVAGGELGETVIIDCTVVTVAGRTDSRRLRLFIKNR